MKIWDNEPPRGKPLGIFSNTGLWEVRSARKFINTSGLIPTFKYFILFEPRASLGVLNQMLRINDAKEF
jgi:hypothetical protein